MLAGHELRKCAELVRNVALKERNTELLHSAEAFLEVRKYEWPVRVSGHALSALQRKKRQKVELLPCTADLLKVLTYMKNKIEINCTSMESDPTSESWHQLEEVVLARVIVFNKRRAGEVARMSMEDYHNRPKWQASSAEEFRAVLSPLEKQLCERMQLIKIVGKRQSSVPVLLTEDVVKAIDILVQYRDLCGIAADNPFLFANNTSRTGEPLRGHDCIRRVSLSASLQHPERVTSTRLRKYMATVSQIFELSGTEVDWLARHLGHDITVHREYYRLHDSSVELAKISKLLLKVDGGNPQDWKGCRLDDINLKLSDDDASSTDEECEEFQQAERVASIREDDIEPDTDEGEDESEHVEANNTVGMCKIETAGIIFIFAELWFL